MGAKMAPEAQAHAARPWRVRPGPGRRPNRACAWASSQGRLRSTRPGRIVPRSAAKRAMFARFEKYQRGRHRFLLAAVRTPLP